MNNKELREVLSNNNYRLVWLVTNEIARISELCYKELNLSKENIIQDNILKFDITNYSGTTMIINPEIHFEKSQVAVQTLIQLQKKHFIRDNRVIFVSTTNKVPSEILDNVDLFHMSLPNTEDFRECKIEDRTALGLTVQEYIRSNGDIKFKENKLSNLGLEITQNIPEFKLLGMDKMKNFVLNSIKNGGRGIIITGVPGTGKSAFAKHIAQQTQRPLINLSFGKLKGSYVGETEEKTDKAFKTIENSGESIVFIDEIEKGLSGVKSDNSVSKGQGGQFLTWMQDKQDSSYIIATANNIQDLPPEYLRSGRWDAIFFLDIPSKQSQKVIFETYKQKFNVEGEFVPNQFTGAEIENICRLAKLQGLSTQEAQKFVKPISITMKQEITHMREWGENNAINATDQEEELF